MTTIACTEFQTISLVQLDLVTGGDGAVQNFLNGTGRVLDTMVHDGTVGAVGGGAIGAGVGLAGGPAAPVTVAGGAATGAALGTLGGAAFGLGRGIGNEIWGRPAAQPPRR
jgi:hypothetical protein